MLHTGHDPQRTGKPGAERAFGLVFAGVFLLVSLWPIIERAPLRAWALGVAAVFALCACLAPRVLAPLNRLWLRFGGLLHRIVSPIVLGVLFFGVIAPYALVMRFAGRDALLLRKRSARRSYWVRREPPGPPPDSLRNQF